MEDKRNAVIEALRKGAEEKARAVRESRTEPQEPYELFGIECGDGWKELYQPILDYVGEYNKTHDEEMRVCQVKEKFGGLRVYLNFYDDTVKKMIDDAESKSFETCEICGAPCKQHSLGSWIYTMCDDCFNKMLERRKEGLRRIEEAKAKREAERAPKDNPDGKEG